MAATVMGQGTVKAVIVGTDRVAANGDVANKIGTYTLAVLAATGDDDLVVVDEGGGEAGVEQDGLGDARGGGGGGQLLRGGDLQGAAEDDHRIFRYRRSRSDTGS